MAMGNAPTPSEGSGPFTLAACHRLRVRAPFPPRSSGPRWAPPVGAMMPLRGDAVNRGAPLQMGRRAARAARAALPSHCHLPDIPVLSRRASFHENPGITYRRRLSVARAHRLLLLRAHVEGP